MLKFTCTEFNLLRYLDQLLHYLQLFVTVSCVFPSLFQSFNGDLCRYICNSRKSQPFRNQIF
uniref:Uncharacterized protein n=1 Tax=Rhizophora mucronata TaxID=61149 RepID=A0A2P2QJJ1_RHIMU